MGSADPINNDESHNVTNVIHARLGVQGTYV